MRMPDLVLVLVLALIFYPQLLNRTFEKISHSLKKEKKQLDKTIYI